MVSLAVIMARFDEVVVHLNMIISISEKVGNVQHSCGTMTTRVIASMCSWNSCMNMNLPGNFFPISRKRS